MLYFLIFHSISASQLNDNLWLDPFRRIKFSSAGWDFPTAAKPVIGRQRREANLPCDWTRDF